MPHLVYSHMKQICTSSSLFHKWFVALPYSDILSRNSLHLVREIRSSNSSPIILDVSNDNWTILTYLVIKRASTMGVTIYVAWTFWRWIIGKCFTILTLMNIATCSFLSFIVRLRLTSFTASVFRLFHCALLAQSVRSDREFYSPPPSKHIISKKGEVLCH
jgi:hypothetical protein